MTKVKKRLLIIGGIVLTVVAVVVLTLNGIVAGILENKVDAFLKEHPVKNYQISYDRVGFNFLNRSVRIVGLEYKPEPAYLDSVKNSGFKAMIPEIEVGKFIVSGINFVDLIKNKKAIIGDVTIKYVFVKLNKIDGKKHRETAKEEATDTIAKTSIIPDSVKIKGLNGLLIEEFEIKKSRVEIYNLKSLKTELTNREIRLTVKNIKLEKKNPAQEYLFLDIEDILLEVDHNVFKTADNLYEITFDRLQTTFRDKTISIKNFHFNPLFSKKGFSKQIKYQQERYDISSPEVLLSSPDYSELLADNELNIHSVVLKNPDISIYRDKRLPFPHFKRPLLPHQALKRMAMKLNIDTVTIDNATFVYEEKTDKNSKTLNLDFQKLNGTITNICNNPEELEENGNMEVSLNGKLMGAAPFNVSMIFPMQARNDTFVFSGTVNGKVSFKIFNKAIYPAAGIKFDGGTLNKMTFKGGANAKYSTGTMTLLYHDLSMHIVKNDEVSRNKFLSWSASALIRKNNPDKNNPPKKAVMVFERDIEKGFGNFFWKTILSGLKGTMVVSMNKLNANKAASYGVAKESSSKKKNKDSGKNKKKWFWQKKKK